MEIPPASEHPTPDRSDGVRDPVRNDIGLDGEWEHQQLCEDTSLRVPVVVGRFFVHALTISTSGSLIIHLAERRC